MADFITVPIHDIDDEGLGVGAMADGTLVHVPQALPGETVRVEIEHVSPHGRGAWGRLTELLAPSPSRVAPACRAWGDCGGCPMLHWRYEEQLAWKRRRLERALGIPVGPCVASPDILGYRNRSKLSFGFREDRLVLGAFAPRSHRVVEVDGCAIACPPLDAVATTLASLARDSGLRPYDEAARRGDLRHALLRVNHAGEILVLLVVARRGLPLDALVAGLVARHPAVVGVVENLNTGVGNALVGGEEPDRLLAGRDHLDDVVGGTRLRVSSRAFLQVNRGIAALIYREVAHRVAGSRVLDLYCGVGGMALTLAPAAGAVVGVEENAEAVRDAALAAESARVGNARFEAADAGLFLQAAIARGEAFDSVVVNPPRKGLSQPVIDGCLTMLPSTILYVSCSPSTLARDLRRLASSYAVAWVAGFDMLPHTPHVEALVHLVRRA